MLKCDLNHDLKLLNINIIIFLMTNIMIIMMNYDDYYYYSKRYYESKRTKAVPIVDCACCIKNYLFNEFPIYKYITNTSMFWIYMQNFRQMHPRIKSQYTIQNYMSCRPGARRRRLLLLFIMQHPYISAYSNTPRLYSQW